MPATNKVEGRVSFAVVSAIIVWGIESDCATEKKLIPQTKKINKRKRKNFICRKNRMVMR